MSLKTTKELVDQLSDAGLSLSIAPSGKLSVTPSCNLNEELRLLIRASRDALIDWLATPPPDDWKLIYRAYMAHHHNCPTCIAAGRGSRYGLRCGTGSALWTKYNATNESTETPK